VDTSKETVATRLLVFDFELFIGEHREKNKELVTLSSYQL